MTGLREEKKQRMRQALIDSAYVQFDQKGYTATTIADITRHANCAPRTFFQYFSSKEDLLLIGMEQIHEEFTKAILNRPAGTTTLQAMRNWALNAVDRILAVHPPAPAANKENVVYTAAHARRRLFLVERMEAVLEAELTKDLDIEPGRLEPKMISLATAAIFDAYHNDPVLGKTNRREYIHAGFDLLDDMLRAAKGRIPSPPA